MKVEHFDGNELVVNDNWLIDFDCHFVENLKTGFISYFIYYGFKTPATSSVCYDRPYGIPVAIRKLIKSICEQKSRKWANIIYYRVPSLYVSIERAKKIDAEIALNNS